ncbi:MAG TPA: LysE family transporter, partial [Verrucomicrobiae bacterium]|nr:LysE family transporter [Verrucomicrobiae bacterium]
MSSILIAALTGFGSGFLISIPVGPVNLGIVNEGAQRGFKHAALIGAGASIMEMVYCSFAFTSFSSFFQIEYVKAGMEVFSFAFMLFLGMKFLMASSVPEAGRMQKHIQGKFHPRSPFMNGLVMVMGNPGVLLFWIILSVN